MKKQFKSLKELTSHLKNNLPELILQSDEFKNVLQTTMRKAVEEVVYDAYLPSTYVRRYERGVDGGLNDVNVMQITDAFMRGDNFTVIFENLAKGDDSLRDEFLTDYIEEGIEDGWGNPNGEWSKPRPFVKETFENIKNNPRPIVNALKDAFRKAGYKVR